MPTDTHHPTNPPITCERCRRLFEQADNRSNPAHPDRDPTAPSYSASARAILAAHSRAGARHRRTLALSALRIEQRHSSETLQRQQAEGHLYEIEHDPDNPYIPVYIERAYGRLMDIAPAHIETIPPAAVALALAGYAAKVQLWGRGQPRILAG